MYYRVAFQVEARPIWHWKSTVLSSLDALFQILRRYRALPQDRLRVFSSPSREEFDKMLAQENNGSASNSVMAEQFLRERKLCPPETGQKAVEHGKREQQERTVSVATVSTASLHERSRDALDMRRLELESGAGGDHDLPYTFTFPYALPEILAWVQLSKMNEQDMKDDFSLKVMPFEISTLINCSLTVVTFLPAIAWSIFCCRVVLKL